MVEVVFSERAAKQLWRLPQTVQHRIKQKLKFWSEQVNPLVFARSLVGNTLGHYRFRIGDYRILFDYTQKQIMILEVGHRREIYK